MPRVLIIAGPNGAGKTTWAMEFLARTSHNHFINADLIASGCRPSLRSSPRWRLPV